MCFSMPTKVEWLLTGSSLFFDVAVTPYGLLLVPRVTEALGNKLSILGTADASGQRVIPADIVNVGVNRAFFSKHVSGRVIW